MIPKFEAIMSVQEAFLDADDVPTVILHGAIEGFGTGPMNVYLKGTALDMDGVAIGSSFKVSFSPTGIPEWLQRA